MAIQSPIEDSVLLRAVCEQLTQHIIPAIASEEAAERARFSVLLLQRVAGRLDLLRDYSAQPARAYRQLLTRAVETARRVGNFNRAETGAAILASQSGDQDPNGNISEMRAVLVELINHLCTPSNNWFHDGDSPWDIRALMADLIGTEKEWREGYEELLSATPLRAPTAKPGKNPAKSVKELVTTESATRYLRAKLTGSRNVAVTDVAILPGGRSKYTIFLRINGTDLLPEYVVMRQDSGATMIPTSVVDEYPLLKSLHLKGLHTAEPLYLESDHNELGRPFMLVSRLVGKAPGDYFTFSGGNREIVAELARTLARMHRLDVSDIDIPQQRGLSHVQYALQQIAYYRNQWHENALEPSPVVEYAFAWLDRECRNGMGGPALVHGDIAPHNYLVHQARLTGIVDWEFAHIGDPAEDLAYRRTFFEQYMPWSEFLDIYYDAGGHPIDERRLKMFAVWGYVRNAAFGALGHREFKDGSNPDFANAALSTYLYSFFDRTVAGALQEFR